MSNVFDLGVRIDIFKPSGDIRVGVMVFAHIDQRYDKVVDKDVSYGQTVVSEILFFPDQGI